MADLVLTLVGDDRAGLVRALADTIAAHGGNWERSELAELGGAFAGIVLVSVSDDRLEHLQQALTGLRGLLRITPHAGVNAPSQPAGEPFVFTVLGNDQPGIIREITGVLEAQGLSIDRLTSKTEDAPMAGGVLFEATVSVRVPHSADVAATRAALERLAGEIQVDLTVGT